MATLIFFSPSFHEKVLNFLRLIIGYHEPKHSLTSFNTPKKLITAGLSIYIVFQLAMPFRYKLYEGDVFWTEQGYRFSWRVMLMEKAGYATFYVTDPTSDAQIEVNNEDYLTPNQEKMMSTQPDMILQFAHHLEEKFTDTTVNRYGIDMKFNQPEVHAEVYVTLNSRPHQLYVDRKHDLAAIDYDLTERTWLEAFEE